MAITRFVTPLLVLLAVVFGGVCNAIPPQDLPAQAAAGNAQAQFELGKKYNHGLSKTYKKDFKEAIKWLKAAAKQNHAEAIFHMGVMHERGRGLLPDATEAANWYLQAANLGNVDAMYTLSLMYGQGEGVPQDPIESDLWYQQAVQVWDSQ